MTWFNGTVKWFDLVKNYGFISPDEQLPRGGEVFVDSSAITKQQPHAMLRPLAIDEDLPKTLFAGQKVRFQLLTTRGGRMRATNVEVTAEAPVQSPCPSTQASPQSSPKHEKLTLSQLFSLAEMFEAAGNVKGLLNQVKKNTPPLMPCKLDLATLLGI